MRNLKSRRGCIRMLLSGIALAIALLVAVLFVPVSRKRFPPLPATQAPGYADAVRQIQALIARTPEAIRPECRTSLLDHGRPTDKVFVLMHGLSNCPAQFAELARQLHERGHNVLVPRLPYHGEKNRLATDWGRLTAQEILDSGNQAVDLARGLGKNVIVVGLSLNGTTVAWMAQNRADLAGAVLLSPFLAPEGIPNWAAGPLGRLLRMLPNAFIWWDPRLKENLPGPPYAYPRFPTRVIGQTLLLSEEVLRQAQESAPRSRSVLVVTTAADRAASHQFTKALVEEWRARGAGIETYVSPLADNVPHDFIDPNQPDQKVSFVYPRLVELLEK